MPRRRKKRNSSELPRLHFIESPSSQSPPRLSPEFGAINPIGARTVPVNDIHDLSWVTPQFGEKSYHFRQCHANPTIRRTTRVRGSKSSDTRSLDAKCYDAVSKYKPLSFITKSCNSRQSKEMCIQDKNGLNQSAHSTVTDTGNNQPSPKAIVSDGDSYFESFKISTPVLNHGNHLHQGNFEPFSETHHRRKPNPNENDGLEQLDENNLRPEDGYHSDNDRIRTSSDSNGNCDKDKDCHELSIVFGKVRAKRPFVLEFPSSPPPSPVPEVLVADTPECDYDLTLRQRQIKYLLRPRPRLS